MVLWVSSISGCGLCVSCLARVASLGVQSIYKSLPFSEARNPGGWLRPFARKRGSYLGTILRGPSAVQTGSRHHAVQGNGLVRRRVQPQQPQQPQQALFAALFTESPATLSPAYHQLRRRHRHRHYHHHYHRQVSFTVRCHQVAVSAALAVRPSRLPRRLQQHHLPLASSQLRQLLRRRRHHRHRHRQRIIITIIIDKSASPYAAIRWQCQLHWQCAHHAFHGAFSSTICPWHHHSSASCSVAVATIGTVIGSAIIITIIITESASLYAAIGWQCQLH